MQSKEVILVKEPGKDIPEKAIEMFLLHHGAMFSAAIAEVEDGRPRVSTLSVPLKDSKHPKGALGDVMEVLSDLTDTKAVLCFSSEEIDPQPHSMLVNDKAEDALVAFLDGNFEEPGRDTDGHSHSYVEANDYLQTKILALAETCDDDVVKLIARITDPNNSKELSKMGQGERMCCVMFANNGDAKAFHRPPNVLVKYDWGTASHDVEAVDKVEAKPEPVAAAAPAPAKSSSLFDRAKSKLSGSSAAPPTVGTGTTDASPSKLNATPEKPLTWKEKAELKKKGAEPLKTMADIGAAKAGIVDKSTVAGPAQGTVNLRVVKIPQPIELKNRRKFVQKRLPSGVEMPVGWEKLTEMVVPLEIIAKIYPKQTAVELMAKYPPYVPPVAGTSSVPSIAQKHAAPAAAAASTVAAEDMPVFIPAEHKANLENRFFKKPRTIALMSKDGKNIDDPTLTPAAEDKVPPFWQSLGMPSLESTFHFKSQDFHEMGSYSLNAVARAAFDYKANLIKALRRIKELEAKGTVGDVAGKADVTVHQKPKTWAERRAAKVA